jgi:prolyl oligopeptidase
MVLVTVLDNVVSKLYQYTQDASGKWNKSQVAFPDKGTISVFNTNEESDRYFVNYQNFLTPSALFMVSGPGASPEKIKSEPDFFDSSPYQVDQLEAVSKDGTRIPYFIIQEKQNQYNGKNPTLLYGYMDTVVLKCQ